MLKGRIKSAYPSATTSRRWRQLSFPLLIHKIDDVQRMPDNLVSAEDAALAGLARCGVLLARRRDRSSLNGDEG